MALFYSLGRTPYAFHPLPRERLYKLMSQQWDERTFSHNYLSIVGLKPEVISTLIPFTTSLLKEKEIC